MPKIRFEPTITWGTVLTLMAIVGSMLSVWMRLEKIVDNHETRLRYIERRIGLIGEYKEPSLQYESIVPRKPGS